MRRYKVSDITGIGMIQNEMVRFPGGDFIVLEPGLKITFKPSASIKTIIVDIPENAEQFASQLKQLTGTTTWNETENEF